MFSTFWVVPAFNSLQRRRPTFLSRFLISSTAKVSVKKLLGAHEIYTPVIIHLFMAKSRCFSDHINLDKTRVFFLFFSHGPSCIIVYSIDYIILFCIIITIIIICISRNIFRLRNVFVFRRRRIYFFFAQIILVVNDKNITLYSIQYSSCEQQNRYLLFFYLFFLSLSLSLSLSALRIIITYLYKYLILLAENRNYCFTRWNSIGYTVIVYGRVYFRKYIIRLSRR